ncbi:MAG TPA: metallophosphoesterase [Patescibacteria group bacterium]|nr:metallophosphoesterase [Patescibacteria group bacterium]
MVSKRPKLYQVLLFGLLLLGLATSLRLVQTSQEIRKEAAVTSFTFTFVGDTHAGIIDPDYFPKYQEWANYNHQQAVNKMQNLNPNFYLHLGDLVNEPTESNWNRFFNIESSLINSKSIYPTIGNHERYTESKSFYNRFSSFSHLVSTSDPRLVKPMQTNQPWYSFDWGNAHFVSMRLDYDNYYLQGEDCDPGSLQYQWLENDLAKTDKPWKIVFFHVQIYSTTSQSSAERREMRSYLHPLFKKYNVDLVLGGHDHYYERVEKDGIIYIESGGGDNRREPPPAVSQVPRQKASIKNHIVKIDINGGSLTGTAISTPAIGKNWTDPGGQTLDTFNITKTIECIEEGEIGIVYPNTPDCCSGLVTSGRFQLNDEGQCQPLLGGFTCTKCGLDDQCGPGEDFCNCPEDCPTPTPSPSPSESPTTSPSPSESPTTPSPSPSENPSPSAITTPAEMTLNLKMSFKGRKSEDQGLEMNLLIPEIEITHSLQLKKDGTYDDLSLDDLEPSKNYNFLVHKRPYLSVKKSLKINEGDNPESGFLDFGVLKPGDLNGDNQINGIDWSIMKKKYGQSANLEEGDFNNDGLINALDWSLMKLFYGQNGEN